MKVIAAAVGILGAIPEFAHASNATDGSFGTGFLIIVGFIAACFGLVALIRAGSGSERRGPDEVSVDEFVRSTTSIDRPSIER
jgi:hypothetical protein